MANVTLWGVSYPDVPAVELPQTGGGTVTFYENGGQTTEIIVPEQTITASTSSTQLTFNKGLVVGDEYIYTINGTTATGEAYSMYGSTYLGVMSTNKVFEYINNKMYFTVGSSSYYGTYTVKVVMVTGGGGGATLITKTITENGTYDAEDDDADGYSSVTVNVPQPSSMNVQVYNGYASRKANSYGATSVTLTVAKTGTYTISWVAWRSSNSGTMGTNLHIGSTAESSNHETFTGTYGQSVTLTGKFLTQGQVLTLYATSGSSSRTIYVANLAITQTA